jgi:hypothetical protein
LERVPASLAKVAAFALKQLKEDGHLARLAGQANQPI